MSFADTIKSLIFKSPAQGQERRSDEKIADGRRKGESDNPYLSARRTWNEITTANINNARMWQLLAILCLLIALGSVGGIIHIGSQSKFIPYVVEVNKFGQASAAGPADRAAPADIRVIKSKVASFIEDARLVTPDVALQRKAILRVYTMLSANDPATKKMNEWLNGTKESNPFVKAEKVMINVEILSVIKQTEESWQVEWTETKRDRQGVALGQPERWRALVTVYTVQPTEKTTEAEMSTNPLGIHVRNYDWAKQI